MANAPTTDQVLDRLTGRHAPVVTVVVPAPDADEHTADRRTILVKEVRSALADHELSDELESAVVERVEAGLADATPGTALGVVADAADVLALPLLADEAHVGDSTLVEVGALPRFVPFLRDRFDHRPHVIVRCDRTGAEIDLVERGEVRAAREVHGEEQHVQKVRSGGWSHSRMQRHAEHTWDQNAQAIVRAVVGAADRIDAELLVITGDERAIGLVEQHLPEHWHDRAVFEAFEATDADDEEHVSERAATLVRDRAATEIVELLKRFAEARGRGEGAADGTDDVFAALRRGAVETLLVAEDVGDTVHVAEGDPMQLATDAQALADLGIAATVPARLTDAAIAAAAAGGADVVVVPTHGPDSPNGPIGAVLRY